MDVTKATFFDPGISYEKRIGKFQSLYAKAFLSTNIILAIRVRWAICQVFIFTRLWVYNTGNITMREGGRQKESELK